MPFLSPHHRKTAELITNGLIGYWPTPEGAGLSTADQSGYGNDASFLNMDESAWVEGPSGPGSHAINFNESSTIQMADIGNAFPLNVTGYPSLCLWMKSNRLWVPANSAYNTVFQKGSIFDDDYIGVSVYERITDQTTSLRYGVKVAGSSFNLASQVSNDFAFNSWQHVCVTPDPTTQEAQIYVDGSLLDSGNVVLAAQEFDRSWRMAGFQGTESSQRRFNGRLTDLRIYDRPLSASEVNRIYNGTG